MPSSDPLSRFEDIVRNIERIERYTEGIHSEDSFEENQLVYDAVERCLQRISEAATKLSSQAEILCPSLSTRPQAAIKGYGGDRFSPGHKSSLNLRASAAGFQGGQNGERGHRCKREARAHLVHASKRLSNMG